MTAEIAVLNKTAVALAADSAVTISAGSKEEKIFNTADKLFELSNRNPIGVMTYNATSIAEIPIASLIREYRNTSPSFSKVETAANHFLGRLHEVGCDAPKEVKFRALDEIVQPIIERIGTRFTEKFQDTVLKHRGPPPDYNAVIRDTLDLVISSFYRMYKSRRPGKFIGGGPPRITKEMADHLRERVGETLTAPANEQQTKKIVEILKLVLRCNIRSPRMGGIIVAGYGDGELFPTLVSYELDGLVGNRLKYRRTHKIDIDRSGTKAKVLPFAQKEMVERFLYGLDAEIQTHLRLFCTQNISSIRDKLLASLAFDTEEAKNAWIEVGRAAEREFLAGLGEKGFEVIRSLSESEIETMVEFMPKPELAKMAEALVNLTSIKRQVSRGMETVGGPVDVAVISASEGFVWVKRKHYFPAELNSRYFERLRTQGIQFSPSQGNSNDNG